MVQTSAGLPRYAYLGPEGTFTESALLQVADPSKAAFLPQIDVVSAIDAVRAGEADYAVAAIENSVEGGVTAVLDSLAVGEPLVIQREMLVTVSFSLVAREGTQLSDVERVAAHPHAWAQCRHWAQRNIPGAVHVPATSNTAPAVELVKGVPLGFDAAFVPPAAVKRYGLHQIASGVADNTDAVTRFVLIGLPGYVPEPTGADKTSLVVHLPNEEAGALLTMLEQFSARGVNLNRIESRPIGDALGRYSFSIDADGHIMEERMSEAFVGLHRNCPHVRYLGSYPKADSSYGPTSLRVGTTDEDFRNGHEWVSSVRNGRAV